MKLTASEILELAALQRIRLTPEEVPQLCSDLNVILEFAAVLHELPEAAEAVTPAVTGNVLREDAVRPSFTQQQALAPAPATEDGFFRVPRTVDTDG
jgi:aspartyl-tRNA(Asn)/glutamyl-tRNA(Gln) amidotransferase subunit C